MGTFSELSIAVDGIFERKRKTDSKLNAILKKVEAGTADMRDTAEFSKRLGHLARQSIFEVYRDELGTRPQWSDVQATVDRILHENYETINELEARVQKDLDRKSGINLAPIKPDYPTERVKKVIDAAANAEDNEQAVRRMGSPVENITVSFHDDYIRENADFRTKAGIECYVERITDGTCCQWCTDIAGKYLMREQPEGFWGKHDNCSCMIIYDGKVLRGQIGENGRRGRRWVEEPPKVEYTPPKRFSHDEAEKLQAELLPRRLTGGVNAPTVDDGSRFYRNVELGNDKVQIHRGLGGEITINALPVLSSSNKLFISDSLSPKPKLIHQVDITLTEVFRSMGITDADDLPDVYIISDSEMAKNAVAAYRAGDNKFFVNADFAYYTRDKAPEIMQDFVCPEDYRSTYYHEMFHWLDAQEYREKVGEITKETYADYDRYVQEKAKKALDKLDKSGYNIFEISEYASESLDKEKYDEAYTEYRTLLKLTR